MRNKNAFVSKKPKNKGNTLLISLIVLIIFLLALLLGSQYSRLATLREGAETSQMEFVAGSTVSVSGTLLTKGDPALQVYTHTLLLSGTTQEVGLKSSTLILGAYEGEVLVEGVVETIFGETPVIEVSNIIPLNPTTEVGSGDENSGAVLQDTASIPNAQLLIKNLSTLGLNADASPDMITLSSTNITEGGSLDIDVIKCSTANPDLNCAQLVKQFANKGLRNFTSPNGDTYYQTDNGRFMTNQNLFGYYIRSDNDDLALKVAENIVVPNKQFIQSRFIQNPSNLCKQGEESMIRTTSNQLVIKGDDIELTLQGNNQSGYPVSCRLKIDVESEEGAQLSEFKAAGIVKGSTGTTTTETEKPTNTSTSTSSIKMSEEGTTQFKINLEKTLTYTTKAGRSVIFPSMNIAYESSNTSTDAGVKGASCRAQTNVIAYKDRDSIADKATLQVYDCSLKGEPSNLPDDVRVIKPEGGEGKAFIIKVVDPAWVKFANNIQVQQKSDTSTTE